LAPTDWAIISIFKTVQYISFCLLNWFGFVVPDPTISQKLTPDFGG